MISGLSVCFKQLNSCFLVTVIAVEMRVLHRMQICVDDGTPKVSQVNINNAHLPFELRSHPSLIIFLFLSLDA